jgi:hypothetical protein
MAWPPGPVSPLRLVGSARARLSALLGLYRVNNIFEILENWLYALFTRLANFKRKGILFLVLNLETCHTSIFLYAFVQAGSTLKKNQSTVPVQLRSITYNSM